MIRIEDATKKNAVEAFGKLLDAVPRGKRALMFEQSVMVETVMMTALSYLGHALPTLEASTDPKMDGLVKQIKIMLGTDKPKEKK